MRAVLRCDISERGVTWSTRWLGARVAGVSLLERHLLGFREAGVDEVDIVGCDDVAEVASLADAISLPGLAVRVRPVGGADEGTGPVLTQRADTIVDPRVMARLVAEYLERDTFTECVVRSSEPEPPEATSPYRVGVPTEDDVRPAEPGVPAHRVGVWWEGGTPVVPVQIGRHYWHRVWAEADARVASRKVLLATMKTTDGMYARTNRRVSLRISAWLLRHTDITPNAVTLVTLGWSVLAGMLFASGTYPLMLLGSLVSWFASMLDGVDGEVARAKLQVTRVGEWLEMACDYLYYVVVFAGMGVGVYRRTHDPLWLVLGVGSAVGAVLAFAAVALWRRRYFAAGSGRDPGLAFQQDVGRRAADPLLSFTRRTMVLATRAALPYYIVALTAVDLVEVLLACTFVGTHAAWLLVVYASRSPVPTSAAVRPAQGAPGAVTRFTPTR